MTPGPEVFISYRREDSQGFAGRLADDLIECFGAEHVFRDDDIPEGEDFARVLERALSACEVIIVMIGPAWLGARDHRGRRLDDPDDWVRREIEAALRRDIWVLPVLVAGAAMPRAESLPAELAGLPRVQALALADRGWDEDLERLARLLMKRIPALRTAPGVARRFGAAPSGLDLLRGYLDVAARSGELAADDIDRPPSRAGRVLGFAWRAVRRLMLWAVIALVAWFALENYASPELRQGVLDFIAFVRDKVGALFGQGTSARV